jgi:hypothetical protein
MAVGTDFVKAVPMHQYAKGMEEGSMERNFIEEFTAESDIMHQFPMKPEPTGEYQFEKTAELPTVAFRALHEDGNISSGKTTIHKDGTFIMDEYIRVDRALVDRQGDRARSKQERMKAAAMSRNWTDVFLKGDNQTNQREPNGLQNRLTTADTNLFHNNTGSGGGPLSLEKLDVAMVSVNRASHIICSRDLLPYWMKAARDPNLTNSTIVLKENDPLGRVNLNGDPMPRMFYNGLPILWGYEPEEGAGILPFTEVGTGGGGAVTSSIYIVSFGDERLFGIESTPLKVTDEGQVPGSPYLSTHAKWDWGIVKEHSRAASRLTSITKAAFVA